MNKKIHFKLKIFFNTGMSRQDCCIKWWEQGQSLNICVPVCKVKLVSFFSASSLPEKVGDPKRTSLP